MQPVVYDTTFCRLLHGVQVPIRLLHDAGRAHAESVSSAKGWQRNLSVLFDDQASRFMPTAEGITTVEPAELRPVDR
jgi:hypothetical protein